MTSGYRLYKGAWIFEQDPHKEKKLSEKEVKALLSQGGIMVRNTFNFDCESETSFWYVIKDSFGGMEELSSKMRNQVKKCFKTMRVEKISSDELVANGYPVYVAAMENYGTRPKMPTKSVFEKRIVNGEENEYWGCFDIGTNKLVAFSMNSVTSESAEYRTMKAMPEYQKLYAYYGLIFEMNRYYLEERKIRYVNDGGRTITNHSNIQSFLIEKFNFRRAYCNLDVYYKWWLGIIVKILFPFRTIITIGKLAAVMNMEAISRSNVNGKLV